MPGRSPLGILKPEYVYQPRKLWARLFGRTPAAPGWSEHRLPWGWPILARGDEVHGGMLRTLGVVDLPVTEVLWRLTDAGETAVDVGANIGCMFAALALRVRPNGAVWGFEPQPEIFRYLEKNVQEWRAGASGVAMQLRALALSDVAGVAKLSLPDSGVNDGLASIVDRSGGEARVIDVQTATLDAFFPEPATIGVLKVDVEGHEARVLGGARALLETRRVRDILFEEHASYPSPVCRLLESAGYGVFRIQRRFRGPVLLAADSPVPRTAWEPTSFLATIEPARALARTRPRGWRVLRTNRRS